MAQEMGGGGSSKCGELKANQAKKILIVKEVALENNAGRWGKMKTELVNGFVNLEVTGES